MPRGIWNRTEEDLVKIKKCLNRKGTKQTKGHIEKRASKYRGIPLTEKHKKTLSLNHADVKGSNNPFYGKTHTEEVRKQISERQKGKKHSLEHRLRQSEGIKSNLPKTVFKKGHLPANYKGGISKTKAYKRKYNRICKLRRRSLKIRTKSALECVQRVYEDNIKQYGTLTCYLCLKPIQFGKDSVEHKIPISRGGQHIYNNLAIACVSCNSKKYTKTEEEWFNSKQEVK